MALPSIFETKTTETILSRLNNLTNTTQPLWGKMNAAQMLAHLNVAYDIDSGKIKSETPALMKFMLKLFLKPILVNEKPYKKNSRTAPTFLISTEKDFEKEKKSLIDNILESQNNGREYYEGRESNSVGKMNANEWSNMYYKHIEHHFSQFGI
jgi:hypothetical protein